MTQKLFTVDPHIDQSEECSKFMAHIDDILEKALEKALCDCICGIVKVNIVKKREFDPNRPIININNIT